MKWKIVAAILMIFPASAQGAFEFKSSGARAAGFSGAYAAQSLGAEAPFWNPAGLSGMHTVEASSFYAQMYSLKELSHVGGAVAFPTPVGGFGFGYSQFGPETYRENEFIFSHGFRLSRQFYAGYGLKGEFLKIQGYGSNWAYALDAGILAPFSSKAAAGFVVKNINRAAIGESKVKIPQGFLAGLVVHPFKGLAIGAGLERLDPGLLSFKSGLEYEWGVLSIRGGAQNNAARFSGGFGLRLKSAQIDYAYVQHSSLSGSHHLSVAWKMNVSRRKSIL